MDDTPAQQAPNIPHAGKRHLPALDAVRGLAAIAVFFFHYGDLGNSSSHLLRFANEVKLRGAYGVDIFFALSGFLITGIFVYSIFLHDTFKTYVLPPLAHTFHGRVSSGLVYLVTVMCLTMLICVTSFHLMEQPFLKLKRHRSPA